MLVLPPYGVLLGNCPPMGRLHEAPNREKDHAASDAVEGLCWNSWVHCWHLSGNQNQGMAILVSTRQPSPCKVHMPSCATGMVENSM